jgi:hypothetical protein
MRLFSLICFLFLQFPILVYATNTADPQNIDIPAPLVDKEVAKQKQNLKQVNEFLHIIDNDKKRENFITDCKSFMQTTLFSFEGFKNSILYLLKLGIIIFIYLLIKGIGVRLLNYRIAVAKERRNLHLKKNVRREDHELLLQTLTVIFKSIFIWVLRLIFVLVFLTVIGIDVSLLIYGASFFGFAVALASQNIIKDFIKGILIILDESMALGETVQVAKNCGRVESISLRSVGLRDKQGDLIIIPFSSINDVKNFSRDYALLRVELCIAHTQDLEVVQQAFEDAAKNFCAEFDKAVHKDFQFLGVHDIKQGGTWVAGMIETMADPDNTMRRAFYTYVHNAMIARKVSLL